MARNLEWADEIKFWKKNAEIYPTNERAYYNLAVAYISRENDLEKAYEEAKKAIEQAPEYCHPRIITASYAIKELKIAISVDPGYLFSYAFLGDIYSFLGEYGPAYKEYKKALAIDSDFFKAKLGIANLYVMKGETETAIIEYEKMLSGERLSHSRAYYAAAYLQLGDLYASIGCEYKAMESWKKVCDEFDDQIWFSEIAHYLTGTKKLSKLLKEMESWQPEFKMVGYYHIGFKKEMDGDLSGAVTYYLEVANIATKAQNHLKNLALKRLSRIVVKGKKYEIK